MRDWAEFGVLGAPCGHAGMRACGHAGKMGDISPASGGRRADALGRGVEPLMPTRLSKAVSLSTATLVQREPACPPCQFGQFRHCRGFHQMQPYLSQNHGGRAGQR